MLFLLIGRTDMDRRTFTKSEGSEITWAVKDRRNNNPREISHLIVKPCAIGAVPFLVTKSVPDTVRVRWVPERPKSPRFRVIN